MSRSTHKLRARLNGGKYKSERSKYIPAVDKHVRPLDGEIDRLGISELYYCTEQTVTIFIKKGIIKAKEVRSGKKIFDSERIVEALSPFIINGRLSATGLTSKYLPIS